MQSHNTEKNADTGAAKVHRALHPNGQIAAEWTEVNGVLHGYHRKFFLDGTCESDFTFERGQSHGLQNVYFPSGQLKMTFSMKMGRREGTNSFFGLDGKVLGESTITNGTGLDRWWNPDGTMSSCSPQVNGRVHGVYWFWDEDELKHYAEGYYLNGKKVPKAKFLEATKLDSTLFAGVPEKMLSDLRKAASKIKSASAVPASAPAQRLGDADAFLARPGTWTLGELGSNEESKELIDAIFDCGAKSVSVGEIGLETEGGSASMLSIIVGKKSDAKAVLELLEEYGILGDIAERYDVGTKTLTIQLD